MTFDPLVEERTASGGIVARDVSDGAPMIVPRGETEPVKYGRASGLADYLAKDIFGIKRWEMRYLAIGLGQRPDLAALAAVESYTTGLGMVRPEQTPQENRASGARLDEIIARALDHAGIHEKADAGTVAHAATEQGYTGPVPSTIAHVVDAYRELTAGLVTVATEVFVANDATRTAGTFDHAYRFEDQKLAGELSEELGVDLTGTMIGDKKTGKNMHVGDFEIQLGGTYADGEVYLGPPVVSYDADTEYREDQRIPLSDYFGDRVNASTGLLVHISTTGSPKPRVLPIDLERGRRLAKMACAVRDAREELDKIGVPKKLPMDRIARRVLDGELKELGRWHDEQISRAMGATHLEADADQGYHMAAQELWGRFRHIWTEQDTLIVKGRTG